MTDSNFEAYLHRLFAEPGQVASAPALDAGAFADRVRRRLERRWALRRGMITLAGVMGALIAGVQVMSAHLIGQADALSQTFRTEGGRALGRVLAQLHSDHILVQALPFGPEAIWLIGGLAIMAGAFLATRLFETL
jgi:predicted trehalose synthase